MREAAFDFARSEDKDCDLRGQDDAARARPIWPRRARSGRTPTPSRPSRPTSPTISAADPPGRAGPAGRGAEPSRGTRDVRRARLSPAAARRPSATTCSRSIASCASQDGLSHEEAIRDAVASVLLSPHFCYRIDLAAPGRGRAAAVGLRPGQPAELLPLVEHARRRAAGPRRRRRPAPAGRAASRRRGACSATTASAAWPPSSPATGWSSAASRSTTASIASGSRASPTSCGRRCSRSRSASSSTSRSATARCSTSSTPTTRSSTRSWRSTTACPSHSVGPDEWVRVDDARPLRPRRPACRWRSS